MKAILTILLTFLTLQIFAASSQVTYYFDAVLGDDSRTALQAQSSATPWKSTQRLADIANGVYALPTKYNRYMFKRGQVFPGHIVITATLTGTATAPFYIGAWGTGERPEITGFVDLKASTWVNAGTNLYTNGTLSDGSAITTESDPMMVMRNGAIAPISRFPNYNQSGLTGGFLKVASSTNNGKGLTSTFTSTNFTTYNPKNGDGSEYNWKATATAQPFVVTRYEQWAPDLGNLVSISAGATTTIGFTQHYYGSKPNWGFYLVNHPKACDQDGEWAYSTDNIVTMYSTTSLSGAIVQIPKYDNVINITNGNYITFEGIKLSGGNNLIVQLKNTKNVTFQDCDIENGRNGIGGYSNSDNLRVVYSTIKNITNKGGKYYDHAVGGYFGHDSIANIGVFDMAYYDASTVQGSGIDISKASAIVEYCKIDNIGMNGIGMGEYDNQIAQYNEISRFCKFQQDGGGLYYSDSQTEANWSNRKAYKNLVRDPYNTGGYGSDKPTNTGQWVVGMYYDNYADQVTATYNTFINVPDAIELHHSTESVFQHNNVYNSTYQNIRLNNNRINYGHGADLQYNDFLILSASPYGVYMEEKTGTNWDLNNYGTIDHNRYFRPSSPTVKFRIYSSVTDRSISIYDSTYSFAGWKNNFSPWDANSSITPPITGTMQTKVVYNWSDTSKIFTLGGLTWIDFDNNAYKRDTVTLLPYSSLLLIQTPSVPLDKSTNKYPTVAITSPADSSKFNQPINLNITATAADADGSIAKVEFYNGSTLLGSDVTSPYSYAWNSVPAGSFVITAKAYDNLGASTYSKNVNITVTGINVPPSVSIDTPANNTIYISPADIRFYATASDPDGSINRVDFYRDTTLIHTENVYPYQWTWTGVTPGSYSITAKAVDNLGAVTASNTVNLSVHGLVAPSIAITSPTNQQTFIEPAFIVINATATDVDGKITKVEFYKDGVLINTDLTSPYSYTMSNVQRGTDTLMAKAYDNDGLSTTSSVVTIVNAPNKLAPSVSLTGPTTTTYSDPASINITANASDADGTIAYVSFYSNSNIVGTDYTAPYSITYSSVAGGSYSLTALAKDNDSLSTTSTAITVTVNHVNIPPTINILEPGDSAEAGSPVFFNAYATDVDGTIAKVEFYNGSTLIGTATSLPYSIPLNLSAGTYTLTAKATDNTGATTSKNLNYKVYNPSPNAPIRIRGKAIIK